MSVQFPFGKKTIEFPYNPDELADRLQHYVDLRGEVRGKHSNAVQSYLNMVLELEQDDLAIEFMVNVQSRGNGSHQVRIFYMNNEVLGLSGYYTSKSIDTKVDLYSPGKWEALLPPQQV